MTLGIEQEIARLRSLVELGHRSVDAGAPFFVVWGVLSTAAAVATHGTLVTNSPFPIAAIWGVAIGVAWLLTAWLAAGRGRRSGATSVADRLLAFVWTGCGIAITLVAVSAAGPLLPARAVAGATALILGTGYFASSPFAGRWLAGLAALWWVGGVVLLTSASVPTLLLFGAMLIALQVVPGILLMVRTARAARK